MKNRNVIITGATSGIGLATAKELAKQGANIYIIARDKRKAEKTVIEIITETSNKNVFLFIAELSSQKSVRSVATEIKSKLDRVDVLINNAGGLFPGFKLSEDGIEITIAVNHFAPFLLTNLLLDNVKKSDYARIITLSSQVHYSAKLDFESFTKDKHFSEYEAYSQSKLCNNLFTFELARRLKDTQVTANSLHPGVVRTNFGKGTSFHGFGGISPEEGARTSVYLASSHEVQGITGKYFDKSRIKEPSAMALDVTLQKKLWEVSEKLCPI